MLDNRSSCHEKTKLLNASPSKSPQEGCSSASLRRDVWIILNYSSTRIAHSSLHLASYILQCSILTLILLNVVVAIVDSSQGPRTQKNHCIILHNKLPFHRHSIRLVSALSLHLHSRFYHRVPVAPLVLY